jgi:hypothetical protein
MKRNTAFFLFSVPYITYCYTVYPLNTSTLKYIPSYTVFKKSRVERSKKLLKDNLFRDISSGSIENIKYFMYNYRYNLTYSGFDYLDVLLSVVDSISTDDYIVSDLFTDMTDKTEAIFTIKVNKWVEEDRKTR